MSTKERTEQQPDAASTSQPDPLVWVKVNAGSRYVDASKNRYEAGMKLKLPKSTADALIRAGTMLAQKGE